MRKSINKKMCLYARPNDDSESGFDWLLIEERHRWFMNDHDVMMDTVVVEFFPPEDMSTDEITMKAIETMREKQKQIRADANMRVNKLEAKINNLLRITHQPEQSENIIDIEVE